MKSTTERDVDATLKTTAFPFRNNRIFAPIGLFRKMAPRQNVDGAATIESRWNRGQNRRNVARSSGDGEQEEALLGNSGEIPDVLTTTTVATVSFASPSRF